MMAALELDALTKRFGDKAAVEDLNLRLEPGAFLGLLGRNGAGKSTTLKMVTGLLSLGTSFLWSFLFGGLYALTAWLASGWLVPVMALAFGLALAAHLALLPAAAAYLDRRREVLVERLG